MRYLLIIFAIFLWCPSLLSSPTDDYLIDLGAKFLHQGRIKEAKREFKKALMINPSNQQARKYIEEVHRRKIKDALDLFSSKREGKEIVVAQKKEEVEKVEKFYESNFKSIAKESEKKVKGEKIKIKGEVISGIGFTPEDFIWKRANWDLNELDWRLRSEAGFNRKENTFDYGIYDRIRFIIDTDNEEGFNFHTNIAIDPWSFIGKSQRITIGDGGNNSDFAEIELKYWSNTGYTINESVFTLEDGAAIALPEMKVVDGKTSPTTVTNTWGANLTIPELKIHKEFWPLRELWVDYNREDFHLRVFPLGFQDQALSSDDPLRLSNNHIYWEESPWLDRWRPGIFNTSASDFTAGEFDDQISWFTRNSEGTRLTFLRGFSLEWMPYEESEVKATFASPKTLWQDYDSFESLSGALRAKTRLSDSLVLGLIHTLKLGFKENEIDADNFVWGTDLSFQPFFRTKLEAEIATSRSHNDKTTSFKLRKRGNAFQLVLISNNLEDDILTKDYNEISPGEDDALFFKGRFMITHMDEGFEPGLSTYLETRKDPFWSRHIHFRKPLGYYYAGLYEPSLSWDDIEPYRIGDSIDKGRDVISLRLEGKNFWGGMMDALFDVRNAHTTDGKYLETIARIENTYRVTSRLTTKLLGIYHDLPDTKGGIDPFDTDADTGDFLLNSAIEDEKNPSVKTISLGLQYKFTHWFDTYGIWEHTNDYTVAYDDFPRGILNGTTFTTSTIDGKTYRSDATFLYSQGLFPLPPYPYYDIFKIGTSFHINDKLNIYLDWTRNEYELAGQIDDNINHIGLEIEYNPIDKLGLYFKYVYSRWKDLDRMANGEGVFYEGHHNFFSEVKWNLSENDSLLFQYGAVGRGVLGEFLYDPYGGTLSTLDTQHVFRIYYRRKF
jgi:tetratricopeptide (TPR) repeat protein